MHLIEVTYSKGQTLQLHQFEPTNVHYSAKAEVMEGEDPKVVYGQIKKLVDEMIDVDIEMLQGNTGKIVRAAVKQVIAKKSNNEDQF